MDELVKKFNHLVKRIAQGDISALDEIYEQYGGLFFVMAKKYINNKSLAEEVVSEALCRVVRSAKKFNTSQNGLNWIFKIIKNICIDWNKSDSEYIIVDSTELTNLADIIESPDNSIDQVELSMVLRKLSAEENELLYLKFWESLTVREIAKRLNKPKSTVQLHLDNALKKLYDLLK